MDATTVTSKGQVTIPKALRRRLGIRQGTRIRFSLEGDRVALDVLSKPAEVRQSGFGMLRSRRRAVPADIDPARFARR
jgi:AbrB family looped-hinge helix DNA binding protein